MVFYHGTTDAVLGNSYKLMPPVSTGNLQEKGRKKNLDKVFFTADLGLARVYAGRSCNRFGGSPVVVRVIPMTEVETISEGAGATVYACDWAFCEPT